MNWGWRRGGKIRRWWQRNLWYQIASYYWTINIILKIVISPTGFSYIIVTVTWACRKMWLSVRAECYGKAIFVRWGWADIYCFDMDVKFVFFIINAKQLQKHRLQVQNLIIYNLKWKLAEWVNSRKPMLTACPPSAGFAPVSFLPQNSEESPKRILFWSRGIFMPPMICPSCHRKHVNHAKKQSPSLRRIGPVVAERGPMSTTQVWGCQQPRRPGSKQKAASAPTAALGGWMARSMPDTARMSWPVSEDLQRKMSNLQLPRKSAVSAKVNKLQMILDSSIILSISF